MPSVLLFAVLTIINIWTVIFCYVPNLMRHGKGWFGLSLGLTGIALSSMYFARALIELSSK